MGNMLFIVLLALSFAGTGYSEETADQKDSVAQEEKNTQTPPSSAPNNSNKTSETESPTPPAAMQDNAPDQMSDKPWQNWLNKDKSFRKNLWSQFYVGRVKLAGAPNDFHNYEINYLLNFPVWEFLDLGAGIRNGLTYFSSKQNNAEVTSLGYELAWDGRARAGFDAKAVNFSVYVGYGSTIFSKVMTEAEVNGVHESNSGDGPKQTRRSFGFEVFWDHKENSGLMLGYEQGSLSGNLGNDVGYSMISIGVRS